MHRRSPLIAPNETLKNVISTQAILTTDWVMGTLMAATMDMVTELTIMVDGKNVMSSKSMQLIFFTCFCSLLSNKIR